MVHDLEPHPTLRDAARTAVASLEGYLCGAVDMLVTCTGVPEPSDIVILEVNRVPAMDNYTLSQYVTAIRRYVGGHRIPREDRLPTSYEGVVVV
jgi:D-alanine-D-alanine ligase-like ATP-grasp enzyme